MTPLIRYAALAIIVLSTATPSAPAQDKKEPAAPRVKIAVVNYGYLFTNFDRAKEMKKELDDELAPLKAEAEKIKASLTSLKAAADSAKGMPEVAALIAEQMREGTKGLEDLDLKARSLVGKKQETQLVMLWRQINDVVAEYASKHDFDIVFGYGDPPNLDPNTFANVNRRMTAMDMGTMIPAYVRNGGDITREVHALLQEKYRTSK